MVHIAELTEGLSQLLGHGGARPGGGAGPQETDPDALSVLGPEGAPSRVGDGWSGPWMTISTRVAPMATGLRACTPCGLASAANGLVSLVSMWAVTWSGPSNLEPMSVMSSSVSVYSYGKLAPGIRLTMIGAFFGSADLDATHDEQWLLRQPVPQFRRQGDGAGDGRFLGIYAQGAAAAST